MFLPAVRVLIVDDEDRSRRSSRAALERLGFHCELAEDGQQALQKLLENQYDAVVTELILPRVNGGELVIDLCSRRDAPVVIVHTRIVDPEVHAGLRYEGVDAIFTKSADPAAMAKSIRSFIDDRRWRLRYLSRPVEKRAVETLRAGDNWIQASTVRVETFRLTIMALAGLLLALGWGHSLDDTTAGICKMFGLCGMAFFFCLELVAYHRRQAHSRLLRWSVEQRLDRQIDRQEPNRRPLDAAVEQRPQILVVDPAADSRRTVAAALQRCGYRVIEAATQREALAACDSLRVDLALIKADGSSPQIFQEVQRRHPRTKVSFISGYDNLTMIAEGSRLQTDERRGCLDLSSRPIGSTALVRRVNHLLQEAESATDHRQRDTVSNLETRLMGDTVQA